ncbi:hypothetical protein [Bacillus thuringiensis]|uniref:hypothetical protein n=1 Tax=Bacillus thuringiensis TaxID=1428 RepID=UPI0021D68703|nr:hypothetical protein [Bacillus thuringiensis]MCU7667514.1 hypothetical protein [Bacillus thuringiensis]
MDKYTLITKVRELTQANYMFTDIMAIIQSEYAIIMQAFGISWDEIKQPPNPSFTHYEMVLTENDLRKEFAWHSETLKRTKEKGLIHEERKVELMLKGFIKGVRFFNPTLSYEFSLMAFKCLNSNE